MGEDDDESGARLPASVVEEAERLTHLADGAVDDAEASAYRSRRDELLGEYGFVARVRTERHGSETLVCYPDEWLNDDGVVDPAAIDALDRAVEVALADRDAGSDWEAAEAANRELVDRIRETYGPVHAENAAAFADFMGNHYARPMASASAVELEEFLDEYYPRNAWPSPAASSVVEESVRLVFREADRPCPLD